MNQTEKIVKDKLPQHIAIIMDGNGRWAQKQGEERVFGHQNGVIAVKETVEAAAEIGIKFLTLYAFSTENWNRPQVEVDALMALLISTISKETATLTKNNIRLKAIGDLKSLPGECFKELMEAIEVTSQNSRMTLVLALSYSSKWEITNAMKSIAEKIEKKEITSADVNENLIESMLCTTNIPDPELLIRTSGEHRISNFLLWQIAYSEFYFTDKLWPDFRKQDLIEAIIDYQNRERRFGKTSEQISIS